MVANSVNPPVPAKPTRPITGRASTMPTSGRRLGYRVRPTIRRLAGVPRGTWAEAKRLGRRGGGPGSSARPCSSAASKVRHDSTTLPTSVVSGTDLMADAARPAERSAIFHVPVSQHSARPVPESKQDVGGLPVAASLPQVQSNRQVLDVVDLESDRTHDAVDRRVPLCWG